MRIDLKRLTSLLLVFCLLVSIFAGTPVRASETQEGENANTTQTDTQTNKTTKSATDVTVSKKLIYIGSTKYNLYYKHKTYGNWSIWGSYYVTEIGYYTFQSGEIGYCLQPYNNNTGLNANKTAISWEDIVVPYASSSGGFEQEKAQAISLAMAYGAPNNGDRTESGYYATAALIWDISTGYIKADGTARFSGAPFLSAVKSAFWNDSAMAAEIEAKYKEIITCMQNHGKIPSFSAGSRAELTSANTITLTYDKASGLYKASVTDTNGILKHINYQSSISGLTFTKDGNTLHITATESAAKAIANNTSSANGLVIANRGSTVSVGPDSVFVWNTSDLKSQSMVTMNIHVDPVPSYFNLDAELRTATVNVVKTSSDNKVDGITFTVKNNTTGESFTKKTANGGKFSFDATIGDSITITETVPAGYVSSNSSQTITVSSSGNTVNFSNTLIKGNIQLTKVDSETGAKLSGATFTATDANGKVYNLTETSTGVYSVSNLPYGTYTVKETKAPSGYVMGDTTYTVNITEDGKTYTVKADGYDGVPNTQLKGNIQVTKVDAENGTKLSGATFTATDANGKVYNLTETSTGVYSVSNLPCGTYTVKETKAPTGYVKDETTYTVTITENGKTYTVKAEGHDGVPNTPIRGHIQLTKLDAVTKEKLSGAVFQATSDTGNVYTLNETSTGVYRVENLPYGTYTVIEVSAPEGYLRDETAYTVKIEENGKTYIVGASGYDGVPNNPIKGHIQVTKLDNETSESLAGAVFQATDTNGNVFDFIYAGEGVYRVENLPYGTYTVKEIQAPEGYLKSDKTYTVNITENGKTYIVADEGYEGVINVRIRGNIQLTKLDAETKEVLTGATFTITDEGGNAYEMSEVSPGVHEFTGLCAGVYTVKETKAPEGYLLGNTEYTVTISEHGKTYVVKAEGYDGIPNAPIPGTGTASKTSKNGISAEGFALEIWTDRTGDAPAVTHYLKSDADGKFYVTDSDFAAEGEKVYFIEGLYDGKYSIKEVISSSDYKSVYTESIHIVIKDAAGNVKLDKTYNTADLVTETVDDVLNYKTPEFEVAGLNGVGTMDITVVNNPIPGSATAQKTTTDGEWVDGHALKIKLPNEEYVYLRSDADGKFYITDSEFAEVTEDQEFTIPELYDGFYEVSELFGDVYDESTWQHEALDSIRFVVTDKDGAVVFEHTEEFIGEDGLNPGISGCLLEITGLNGGGTLSIEVVNTPEPGKITIHKVNQSNAPLAGAKFLLEWSRDGITWEPVTFNDTDRVTIGGCQTEGIVDGCLVSDENGLVEFTGLHPMMQYRVTELEAPDGYALLADNAYVGELPEDNYEVELTVVNAHGYDLPSTGVEDTGIYTTIGTTLAILGIVLATAFFAPNIFAGFNSSYALNKVNTNHKRKDMN